MLALPLAIVLVTGLILSFEPWLVVRAIEPGALTSERIDALIARHDPKREATAITHRSYDGTLVIGGRRGGVIVDIATGEARPGLSGTASFLLTSRRMHETLLIDAGWLVITSTIGMLVLALLGVVMGLPRWSNTLSGWHKAVGWGLLPLVVLSPLTGLLIAWGISFAPPRPAAPAGQPPQQAQPMRLAEAVQIIGRNHDLSGLVWLRPQGGALLARIVEGGEYKVYRVTRDETQPTPRNWPRLWHEGNFAGAWSALLNVITSVALIGLLATGLVMWARLRLRRWRRRRDTRPVTAGNVPA